MFGYTIGICSSIIAIFATATIVLVFIFLICLLIKKCIDILKK